MPPRNRRHPSHQDVSIRALDAMAEAARRARAGGGGTRGNPTVVPPRPPPGRGAPVGGSPSDTGVPSRAAPGPGRAPGAGPTSLRQRTRHDRHRSDARPERPARTFDALAEERDDAPERSPGASPPRRARVHDPGGQVRPGHPRRDGGPRRRAGRRCSGRWWSEADDRRGLPPSTATRRRPPRTRRRRVRSRRPPSPHRRPPFRRTPPRRARARRARRRAGHQWWPDCNHRPGPSASRWS